MVYKSYTFQIICKIITSYVSMPVSILGYDVSVVGVWPERPTQKLYTKMKWADSVS